MPAHTTAHAPAPGSGSTRAPIDLDAPPDISNSPELRYCTVCSKRGGPWRTPLAKRCTNCDQLAVNVRRNWAKEYHAARAKAVSRLVKTHHAEFEQILEEERFSVGESESVSG